MKVLRRGPKAALEGRGGGVFAASIGIDLRSTWALGRRRAVQRREWLLAVIVRAYVGGSHCLMFVGTIWEQR